MRFFVDDGGSAYRMLQIIHLQDRGAEILLVLAELDNDRAGMFAFYWTRHFVQA